MNSTAYTLSSFDNGASADGPLSVLVPFKDYDVLPLAGQLVAQAAAAAVPVEIVFADDGSVDASIGQRLIALFSEQSTRCRVLTGSRNVGRSAIRNRLAESASSPFLLYLDADILPDDDAFLDRYLRMIAADDFDVACGGRSYLHAQHFPHEHALYRYFSSRTECGDAAQRGKHPLWFILTNNLCVRRRLVLNRPFSEAFQGWGFEDTDWALSLVGARVLHIDNPATHMGLLNESELLKKYDSSIENFLLIAATHPEFRRFALYRASRLLARLPAFLTNLLQTIARVIVTTPWLPIPMRHLGIQAYRVALYAGPLRAQTR